MRRKGLFSSILSIIIGAMLAISGITMLISSFGVDMPFDDDFSASGIVSIFLIIFGASFLSSGIRSLIVRNRHKEDRYIIHDSKNTVKKDAVNVENNFNTKATSNNFNSVANRTQNMKEEKVVNSVSEQKWICPYCGSENLGTNNTCPNCGAKKE